MNKFSIRKRWLEKIWEKNVTLALIVLYTKKEKIYLPYVLKNNSNREKQAILLMLLNINKQIMMALSCSQKISALLRGITSKHYS